MAHAVPARTQPDREVLDVVGVGFGPSNLALAIALHEHNAAVPAGNRVSSRFVERQGRFGWHRGMLIDDATMQVSFLKDLVTLRNPASPFSFLSYLHTKQRLVDFINYGSVYPTRLEFHDYLEWAAQRFAEQIRYGTEVVEILPVRGGGDVELLDVVCRATDGTVTRLRTRNVVLATGLVPNVPQGVALGERIWHARDLMTRVPELVEPKRLAVVGAGQSAAEAVDYLHRTFPAAEVCAVFARYGFSPADDSSFANRIFDPAAVDDFYVAPDAVKDMLLGYHANTNYSVVDTALIESLYRRHYHEMVAGHERLRFLNVSRIVGLGELSDRVELTVESMLDGACEVLSADAVVYATGYRSHDPLWLLTTDLAAACTRDGLGRPVFRRDYRMSTGRLPDGAPLTAGVFVQGATEHTHGISSTLLSNVAVRSGEIVAALTARTGQRSTPSMAAAAAR
ncbi:lysine N(6)-hydroxylase/L-ornithine N(5)-oxygenase family protein [Actinomycetes bacterium KLBMP 9759]